MRLYPIKVMDVTTRTRNWWLLVVLLLLVITSRMIRLSDFDLDAHENYAVFQSNATLTEIIERTPYDWGAASFLVLGAWQTLAGSDPIILRFLSVLLFIVGSASVYIVMRRLAGPQAAPLALLLYAAPVAILQLSLFVRGYAILIALLPFALYIGLRHDQQPRLCSTVVLAVSLALLIYTHATGLFAAAMIGLFLALRGGLPTIRRFIPVGVLFALLIAPEFLGKTGAATSRVGSMALGLSSLQLRELFEFLVGTPALGLLWIVLMIGAVVGVWRARAPRAFWLLLLWSGLGLTLVYILGGLIGSPRHSWWYILPATLWIAWGLSRLPRPAITGAVLLSVAMLFAPVRLNWIDDSAFVNPPLFANFRWLAQHARWGDVVVVDPNTSCAPFPDEWDNAVRTYFPNGLPFVNDPSGLARVWYITTDGWEDPALWQAVTTKRLASIFVGPPECLFRLYAGPPDPVGLIFDNGLRFHGLEILQDDHPEMSPVVLAKAEALRVRLWWSVDQPLTANYSIALHLYNTSDQLVAQHDGAPQLISLSPVEPPPQAEMIAWMPGTIYVEERTLAVPPQPRTHNGLHPLKLTLIVYQWWDGARVLAPGIDSDGRLPLRLLYVRSW
jgi:hypothetical protein